MSQFDSHPLSYPVRTMRAWCVRVIDADTLHIEADCGFFSSMTVPVRLRGVNAPELNTPEGRAARDAVRGLVEGKPLILTPYRDRQSFARWIGDVLYYQAPVADKWASWSNLADWLVSQGHAVRV